MEEIDRQSRRKFLRNGEVSEVVQARNMLGFGMFAAPQTLELTVGNSDVNS
jgi:hypothetical protein